MIHSYRDLIVTVPYAFIANHSITINQFHSIHQLISDSVHGAHNGNPVFPFLINNNKQIFHINRVHNDNFEKLYSIKQTLQYSYETSANKKQCTGTYFLISQIISIKHDSMDSALKKNSLISHKS